MTKKIMHNLIFVVICYMFISLFILDNVAAVDKCSTEALATKYSGITAKVDKSKVTISLKKEIYTDYPNVNFVLTKIGYDIKKDDNSNKPVASKFIQTDRLVLGGKNHKSLDIDFNNYSFTGNNVILYFTIENDSNCNNAVFELTVQNIVLDNNIHYGTYGYTNKNLDASGEIDCNKDEFSKAFCYARDHKESNKTFKCDTKGVYTSAELKGENYYKNTRYLYKKEKTTQNVGTYTYHLSAGTNYEGESDIKNEPVTCERTCEEAVEVKYGPPIASKAGMCFEYKVKVISRVYCSSTAVKEPQQYAYCDPYPYCYNATWSGNQGGPSDNFDSCIKSCDGGKYTLACSKKCYKQVYSKSKKLSSNDMEISYAKKLNNDSLLQQCIDNSGSDKGCYYRSNGDITWKGSNSYVPGRWYNYHYWGLAGYTYSVDPTDGIYKASNCSDTCFWTGCPSDTYLNYYNYEKDAAANDEVYQLAQDKCNGMASCSESTAEFTIEADYKSGGTVKTIKFPYENKKDTVTSKKTGFSGDTRDNSDTTLIEDDFDKNVKSAYKGCYEKNGNLTNRYRVTWSFPGTWINLKTGEVSFKNLDKKSAWYNINDKFCIPLDAQSVNVNWWNYYYGIISKNMNLSTDDSVVKNYCNDSLTTTFTDSNDKIEWNIRASTKKFGYFGWNINVNCFYALNDSQATTTNSGSDSKKCTVCENDTCYRIRSVDLNNLFPKSNGETLSNKDVAGRTPGFNWSSYANTNNGKNNDKYLSVPNTLIKNIQNKGNSIYNDDNLDYQFYLSPSTLKSMRKSTQGSGDNYTDFDATDFKIDENGVGRYTSSKIRDIKGEKKIPDKSSPALRCNNMKNYANSACEEVK